MKRYHWKVLPQGKANSPTSCQTFVAQAIQVVCDIYSEAYVIHYMDDILCSHADPKVLSQLYGLLKIQIPMDSALLLKRCKCKLHSPIWELVFYRGSFSPKRWK